MIGDLLKRPLRKDRDPYDIIRKHSNKDRSPLQKNLKNKERDHHKKTFNKG